MHIHVHRKSKFQKSLFQVTCRNVGNGNIDRESLSAEVASEVVRNIRSDGQMKDREGERETPGCYVDFPVRLVYVCMVIGK
jgi:hypothetical protein